MEVMLKPGKFYGLMDIILEDIIKMHHCTLSFPGLSGAFRRASAAGSRGAAKSRGVAKSRGRKGIPGCKNDVIL
jgi:hypothetical protein